MKNFDDLFSDALNEEQPFQPDERNWQKLSGRLDAFDAGAHLKVAKTTRLWRVVAASVASITLALAYQYQALESRHEALQVQTEQYRRQLEELGRAQTTAQQQLATIPVAPQAAVPESAAAVAASPELRSDRQSAARNTTPRVPGKSQTVQPPRLAPTTPVPGNESLPSTNTLALTPENNTTKAQDGTGNPVETTATAPATTTNALALLPVRTALPAQMAPASASVQDLRIVTIPQMIRPQVHTPGIVGIGVSGIKGRVQMPSNALKNWGGAGVQLALHLNKNLEVNAGIDWNHGRLSTTDSIDGCGLPPTPQVPGGGGPGNHHELVGIEADIREQRLHLGFKYKPLTKWAVRPVVQAAYVLVHRQPELVTFRFEDKDHNHPNPNPNPDPDPRFYSIKTESKWISDILRLGAGVEYERARWTLGLYTQFDTSLKPAIDYCDVLQFRAGVQYRL